MAPADLASQLKAQFGGFQACGQLGGAGSNGEVHLPLLGEELQQLGDSILYSGCLQLTREQRRKSWLQLQDALHWKRECFSAESFTELVATISYSHAGFKKGKKPTQTTPPKPNPNCQLLSLGAGCAAQLQHFS